MAGGDPTSTSAAAAVVALVGCAPEVADWLAGAVAAIGTSVAVARPQELAGLAVDAVIVQVEREEGAGLAALLGPLGARVPVLLVVPAGAPEPVRDPRVFYVLRPGLPHAAVVALLRGALQPAAQATALRSAADAERMQRILAASARFVGASDLASAARIAEASVRGFVAADRAQCLFHDGASGALWSERGESRERHATTGIAGFVARTGAAEAVEHAAADPRYDPRIDDPSGDGGARLLVVPVGDAEGVHAVFIAARASGPPFSAEDQAMLTSFAGRAGPMMRHLALLVRTEALLRAEQEGLFRAESMRAQAAAGQRGDIIRVSPGWVGWAYWLLVALAAASVVYLCVGEVDQFSSGPAIVRLHARTELAAQSRGPLLAIDAAAGQHVEAGAVLARLDDTALRAELARVRRDFEAQLRRRMQDPGDVAAAQTLISLRGEERAVQDRLLQQQIRAPRAGTVSDLRIRAGQHIEVGDVVMSLVHDDERRSVVALLPGGDRPQLRPGMALRLELRGYRYAYQDLVIDEVSNEVIGPAEARRFLGPQLEDAVTLPGPVVVVVAALPGDTFTADAATYNYHDGMPALADVRLRSESILELFFPAFKRL